MQRTLLLWLIAVSGAACGRIEEPPPSRPVAPPATSTELENWWNDLGLGAAVARAAQGKMLSHPAETVSWMRQRLQPVMAADAGSVQKLIEKLDSPHYGERERATWALEKFGDTIQPALHRGLNSKVPERHRRLELLLAKLEISHSRQLCVLRSIAVLEWIGTPPAREIIESLAKGAEGARQTQEARAALERLERRLK